jgi:uncharacterized protein
MPAETEEQISQLLKTMLRKRLFAALNKPVATQDEMLPFLVEHLEYMNRLEREGKIFASGPFIRGGVLVGDGLTIPQANTQEEAMALMEDEPLIKRGLRTFEMHVWEFREGRMTFQ